MRPTPDAETYPIKLVRIVDAVASYKCASCFVSGEPHYTWKEYVCSNELWAALCSNEIWVALPIHPGHHTHIQIQHHSQLRLTNIAQHHDDVELIGTIELWGHHRISTAST